MKKNAIFIMAFAAPALLAAGCSDEDGSSSQAPMDPFTKECNQHINASIKCFEEQKTSPAEGALLAVNMFACAKSMNSALDAVERLSQELQNKKRGQLQKSGDLDAFSACLAPLKGAEIPENPAKFLDCVIPSLKKMKSTLCAKP